MKPSQVSVELRRIASRIEASKNPDRTKVMNDVRRIMSSMNRTGSGVRLAMTVSELITELQKSDPNAQVTLNIGGPDDTAYTNDITGVEGGEITGWVSSDNSEAFIPGMDAY